MCGTWEDGLQIAVCRQAPSTSSNKPYYRNEHYCHNKRSTTLLPTCLAVVKHAFEREGIVVLEFPVRTRQWRALSSRRVGDCF
ncbi:hypothetical protein AVEN_115976-1 [Araneus ventricosus]|uniref:Uncharacterized protein n=1 Tax=Araneus ventricosus TaxID=182803 RepID=A0A4Y2LBW7_ARAVE|nr:hypothetical protein AVEN_115976-1 [Araneus ventricosus]